MCYCSWVNQNKRFYFWFLFFLAFFTTVFKNNCSSFHVLAEDILYTFFLKKGVLSDSCLVEYFLASDALGGFCMNIGRTFLYFFLLLFPTTLIWLVSFCFLFFIFIKVEVLCFRDTSFVESTFYLFLFSL